MESLVAKVKEYGGSVGIAVMDVSTGEILAAHQEHRSFNPASNAKLLTAATALAKLHPNHRYQTALYGDQNMTSVHTLVLRGTGDPTLNTEDLWQLVRELKEIGVRHVEGDILVDQRFFDDQYVPPAFDQQPNEWAPFRAPVSAVALNENTVTLTVRPTTPGAAALTSFDPPGFVDSEGAVKTAEAGASQNIILTLQPAGARLGAKLSGNVPESTKPLRFAKRVENPTLLAGYALKNLAIQNGITISGDVKPGGAEGFKGAALAMHLSSPLSTLLYELGKQSDNFYAEMIFKSIALEQKGRPAQAGNAAEVVTHFLQDIGAFEEGVVVKNGSGLFDSNRVTAACLVKLLRASYRDPSYGHEFVAQLAIGGVDGTLKSRFRAVKEKKIVRAKTGTLDSAAALSGYILGPQSKGALTFSILINDIPGRVHEGRAAIDKYVDTLIRYLWDES